MTGEQRVSVEHQLVPEDYFRELQKEEIFPNERPLELDVGCGDGSFLLAMAEAHPDRNFLGIERLLGRVRKVCRKAERRGFDNVKVLRLESAYALEYLLPAGAATRLHLLCPDPWPKKKHHRRRIVQEANLHLFARVLEKGGEFLFKTDHEDYFEEAVACVRADSRFEEIAWPENEFFYPKTDFEQIWQGQGKAIYRARFMKT